MNSVINQHERKIFSFMVFDQTQPQVVILGVLCLQPVSTHIGDNGSPEHHTRMDEAVH
jgi:hypothetical protein